MQYTDQEEEEEIIKIERRHLKKKIDELDKIIWDYREEKSLDVPSVILMCQQLTAMQMYLLTLDRQIDLLNRYKESSTRVRK